jgi:hypothetical protein
MVLSGIMNLAAGVYKGYSKVDLTYLVYVLGSTSALKGISKAFSTTYTNN